MHYSTTKTRGLVSVSPGFVKGLAVLQSWLIPLPLPGRSPPKPPKTLLGALLPEHPVLVGISHFCSSMT